MFEELMNDEEVGHALEGDKYYIVLPALQPASGDENGQYSGLSVQRANRAYNSASDRPMSREELRVFLKQHGLLGTDRL
jgi:hypothetical protein